MSPWFLSSTASRRRSLRKRAFATCEDSVSLPTWCVHSLDYIVTHMLTSAQIACRCEAPIDQSTSRKISMFCHVAPEQVLGVHDVQSIYHVPLLLQSQGIVNFLRARLKLADIVVPSEMKRKGDELAVRWKDLTMACVIILLCIPSTLNNGRTGTTGSSIRFTSPWSANIPRSRTRICRSSRRSSTPLCAVGGS